jgi:hypothetical protein
MGAKILQTLITSVLIPLLKDLAFMLINMFKVRQIRKDVSDLAKKKAEILLNAKTDKEIADAFRNLQ